MLELTHWWRTAAVSAKPWLILGKGPSFAHHREIDLGAYHLFSLNHVVERLSVDVAHIIDIDVVRDCGAALLENGRWLVMPRFPHVNCQRGERRLEEYFDEYPVLKQLDRDGRLVWYNLSSGEPVEGSPVIQARYFSAEAALDLLGTLGVRKIRSLGIDGGRGYSNEFRTLEGRTMLANGRVTFNQQFEQMDQIVRAHGIDYAPLVEPLRVFVGADESQRVATRVLEYSIRKHTRHPVNVEPMFDLPVPVPQNPDNRPRTGFSFYRFAIPKLCGYRGRALYVDADMQVFSNLQELWDIPFGSQKVLCTNQPDAPAAWRFDGAFFHPGRQMSVMLLDCSRLEWDVNDVVRGLDEGRYSYERLMFDLSVVRPEEIEDRIPPEWNCLEWHDPARTKLLHYTVVPTQPWKNDENPLRHLWEDCFREAVEAGAVSAAEVMHGIQAGYLKASLAEHLPPHVREAALHEAYMPWTATEDPNQQIGGWRAWGRRVTRVAKAPVRLVKRRLRPRQEQPLSSSAIAVATTDPSFDGPRPQIEDMLPLTNRELQDFQEAIDWKTGMELPDGRILGVAGKRGKLTRGIDPRVALLASEYAPADKHVLEVGCCEGIHTVQLARVAKHVTAFDVRPKNIVGTLVRLFVCDVHNATVRLGDARELDPSCERFDIVFHVGVLYHLMDPVEHLSRIAQLADNLLLDTHVCHDDTSFPRADITHGGKTYQAYLYRESGWDDQFSGVELASRWLHHDALLEVLRDVGFESVKLADDRQERFGPRVTLIARRTAEPAAKAA